jgi:hypothetical protein
MPPWRWLIGLGVISGLAVCLSAFAPFSRNPLPRPAALVGPQNLFSPADLCLPANRGQSIQPHTPVMSRLKNVQEIEQIVSKFELKLI